MSEVEFHLGGLRFTASLPLSILDYWPIIKLDIIKLDSQTNAPIKLRV